MYLFLRTSSKMFQIEKKYYTLRFATIAALTF